MNAADELSDAFRSHERLAPDPDDVWRGVADRIEPPRRRAPRAIAVAAGVLVTAGAVAVAVTVASSPDGTERAAGPTQSAVPSRQIASSDAGRIEPLTMPFDIGWLPAGRVHHLARRINVGGVSDTSPPSFDGEYLLTIATPRGELDVDVQQMPGGLDGGASKCSAIRKVDIAGRPGFETADASGRCGYEVYFEDASGRAMYVNVTYPKLDPGPAAELTRFGRRVAGSVRYPGTATVRPDYGVGHVPAGLRVVAFDVENGGTQYNLGTSTDAFVVQVGSGPPRASAGRPGRPVQGHPTRITDENGYRSLTVRGPVHGDDVSVDGRRPLAELYRIADGLILP